MEQNNLNNNDYLQQQIADIQTNSVSSVPNINPQQPMSLAENPKPKKSNGALIAAILFAVLALAGAGFGIFELMDSNKKSSEISDLKAQISTNKKPSLTSESTGNGDAVDFTEGDDAEVRNLVNDLKTVAEANTALPAFEKIYDSPYAPFAKINGAKTLLNLEKSYGLTNAYSENEAVTNAVLERLKELGFEENTEVMSVVDASVYGPYNYINKSSEIVCSVGVRILCGRTSWVSNETIELANELIDAFGDSSAPAFLYNLRPNAISNSEVSPYQVINLGCYQEQCSFYRTSPDSEWQLGFNGTSSGLLCSEYNTNDLKNAYAGNPCLSDDGEKSTVAPAESE